MMNDHDYECKGPEDEEIVVKLEPEDFDFEEEEDLLNSKSPSTVCKDGLPKHMLPDDLKEKIITDNPDCHIKFTLSQRNNTQMVLDDYLFKKKKGPTLSRGRGRVVYWRCVQESCKYTIITQEGRLQMSAQDIQHNHSPQPELYLRKQARIKLRENVTCVVSQESGSVSSAVQDVIQDTNFGKAFLHEDALKQAARRYRRKLNAGESEVS